MRTVLLSPVNRDAAVELGRKTFRKQVLRRGTLDYEGRQIEFDEPYLTDLAAAFRAGAFDAVPFQLADAGNAHTNDPERTRGEVIGLEVTPDGLDAIVELSDEGAQVVENNPKLGVSARIIEGVKHAMGGQQWPRAIQHVLGTLDPRVTGMRPWEAVQLAADATGETVVDLTNATYTDTPTDTHAPAPDTPSAPELDAEHVQADADAPAAPSPDSEEGTVPVQDKPTTGAQPDELTDEELEQILAEVDAEIAAETAGGERAASPGDPDPDEQVDGGQETDDEGEPVEEPDRELAGAALANQHGDALELARAERQEMALELARLRDESDTNAYEREREKFARESGIPPRIFDLAEKLLKGAGHVVELSNGEKIDAGAIVREVFTEFGKTIQALDLTAELGHQVDLAKDEEERQAAEAETADRTAFSEQARKQFPALYH